MAQLRWAAVPRGAFTLCPPSSVDPLFLLVSNEDNTSGLHIVITGTNTYPIQMVMAQGFELLETMLVSEGAILLLKRHLQRLDRSAEELGFVCDTDVIGRDVWSTGCRQTERVVMRLLLARDGSHQIQLRPAPVTGRPEFLRMAAITVDSADPMLRHKTTARSVYEQARGDCPEEGDVLLTNERGEITETSILNIAVLRDGKWITPPLACGVLPGTMRAELLDNGAIREGVILAADLKPGETIRCFNAVRGVVDVPFKP